ncbi:MAG: zinc ribbon domain-containing protein [Prevotella sp.]|nr:zinc ribbon domain-containing protein [Prevotella sp.]MDY5666778.1 zinc ribbon domain-containing protein [Alloprevotella sp.]
MYKMVLRLLLLLSICLFNTACYYSHPNKVDHWTAANEGAVDSVNFYISHHYWAGYNFQATDSLHIMTAPPLQGLPDYGAIINDTISLHHGDPLVVARIMYVPTDSTDSVWVKVARDQLTQGWVHESELLTHVVPNDPISKFIYYFSDSRSVYILSIFGLAVLFWLIQSVRHKRFRIVHFHDIPSFYPTLLCLCVSSSAALYGSIQRFIPNTWVEFYFHPTLNPFNTDLPFIMALFIASVWSMLIIAIAVVDELRRQPDLGDTLSYIASLGGVCVVLYLVFTLTTPIYIGYPLLVIYWWFAIRQYITHQPSHLLCGVCGKSIPHKGKCPHCGAMNQ